MKAFTLIVIFSTFLSLGQAQSPHLGKLAIDTQVPLVMDGKTIGSMTLTAGAEVTIVQVLPNNEGVLIARGEASPVKIPVEALSTDSLHAAQAALTQALVAQAANQKAALKLKRRLKKL